MRIEGAFYIGIGWLFLLYGLYRALGRPGMSVVLTVFSLGTRVALAYILSAVQAIGVVGIWWSIPIGWALADIVGLLYYKIKKAKFGGKKSLRCDRVIKSKEYYYADIQRVFTVFFLIWVKRC